MNEENQINCGTMLSELEKGHWIDMSCIDNTATSTTCARSYITIDPTVISINATDNRYNDGYSPIDVLVELSSAYYGKQMFFQQDDGTVYDRNTDEYISFDEAVSRMAKILSDDA